MKTIAFTAFENHIKADLQVRVLPKDLKQLIDKMEDKCIKRDAAFINQLFLAITAGFISRNLPTYTRFGFFEKALTIMISYLGLNPGSSLGKKCAMSKILCTAT